VICYIASKQAGLEGSAFFMRVDNKKNKKIIRKRGCAEVVFFVYNMNS